MLQFFWVKDKYYYSRWAGRTWRTLWGRRERWPLWKCQHWRTTSFRAQCYVQRNTNHSTYQLKVTFADAHKSRRNEGTVEFASRRDMEVTFLRLWPKCLYTYFDSQLMKETRLAVLTCFNLCRWQFAGSNWETGWHRAERKEDQVGPRERVIIINDIYILYI